MKDIKNVIGERISIQLEKKGVLQKDLANHLGVSANMVSYYVSGTRTPNFDRLVEIAKFFDVSTDYLLGKTDADTNDKNIQYICDYMHLTKDVLDAWLEIKDDKDSVELAVCFIKMLNQRKKTFGGENDV